MVKECKIITRNCMVIVADYDGMVVQFPNKANRGCQGDTIFIDYKNGKYSIVDKLDIEPTPEVQKVVENVKPKRTTKKVKVQAAEPVEIVDSEENKEENFLINENSELFDRE